MRLRADGRGRRADLEIGGVAGTAVAEPERGGVRVAGGAGQAAANADAHCVDLVCRAERGRGGWIACGLPQNVPDLLSGLQTRKSSSNISQSLLVCPL